MSPASFQIILTPAQFDALAVRYKGLGDASLDSGTLPEQKGVVLGYSINRSSGVSVVVTFTVIRKPRIATVGMIQNEVTKMIGLA